MESVYRNNIQGVHCDMIPSLQHLLKFNQNLNLIMASTFSLFFIIGKCFGPL